MTLARFNFFVDLLLVCYGALLAGLLLFVHRADLDWTAGLTHFVAYLLIGLVFANMIKGITALLMKLTTRKRKS